jgi:transposase
MDGVVELLSGRERRRRWSVMEKLRIVAETHEPGARISGVAARHGVCESLVFTWRRQVREGVLMAPEMATFMPVRMFEPLEPASASMPPPPSQASALTRPALGLIEIELGNGRQVRVGSDVNLAALRRVLTALRG